MPEPVLTREAVATLADHAARVAAITGRDQANPFPAGSDAAACWKVDYERYLQMHSAPEAEGSA